MIHGFKIALACFLILATNPTNSNAIELSSSAKIVISVYVPNSINIKFDKKTHLIGIDGEYIKMEIESLIDSIVEISSKNNFHLSEYHSGKHFIKYKIEVFKEDKKTPVDFHNYQFIKKSEPKKETFFIKINIDEVDINLVKKTGVFLDEITVVVSTP